MVCIPVLPLSIQLPANGRGKVVEDAPSVWEPTRNVEEPYKAPGPDFDLTQPFLL